VQAVEAGETTREGTREIEVDLVLAHNREDLRRDLMLDHEEGDVMCIGYWSISRAYLFHGQHRRMLEEDFTSCIL
jgi:hypothetical protein